MWGLEIATHVLVRRPEGQAKVSGTSHRADKDTYMIRILAYLASRRAISLILKKLTSSERHTDHDHPDSRERTEPRPRVDVLRCDATSDVSTQKGNWGQRTRRKHPFRLLLRRHKLFQLANPRQRHSCVRFEANRTSRK